MSLSTIRKMNGFYCFTSLFTEYFQLLEEKAIMKEVNFLQDWSVQNSIHLKGKTQHASSHHFQEDSRVDPSAMGTVGTQHHITCSVPAAWGVLFRGLQSGRIGLCGPLVSMKKSFKE